MEVSSNIYYLQHKERLNRQRLAVYHKNKNNIPCEYFEAYVANRALYNMIKKYKAEIDTDLVAYLLQE